MGTTFDRVNAFRKFMSKTGEDISEIIIGRLIALKFFDAPASTKYHGAYAGGLFEHSYAVTQLLIHLTRQNSLIWERDASPYIVGMFHDLCKCDQYRHPTSDDGEENPIDWEFNTDTLFKGHGEKSVMIASTLLCLTEEEAACIRFHMGAFTDKDEWPDYTRAIHKYPNVLWTHHADMLASHVEGY